MKKICANLPNALFDRVDRAAKSLDQPPSQILRLALENWLEEPNGSGVTPLAMPDPNLLALDWDEVENLLLTAD